MNEQDNYTSNIGKKEVEKKYSELLAIVKNCLTVLEKEHLLNNEGKQIKDKFSSTLSDMKKDIEKEIEFAQKDCVWDRLVIGFFGETNAGKSTIIETFRILFEENKQGVDGEIVGDGRSDFTKVYNEYLLKINGKEVILIDVPGIEGNEKYFHDKIREALRKAHIIFYIQGHNKKPDSSTVEKIKDYLGNWVNVYSVYNVRGAVSNYDEAEERKTLFSDGVKKAEELIKQSFHATLGDVYKGNVTLQAQLSMCSIGIFEREELKKYQEKTLKYFGNKENVLKFSQFQTAINIIEQKAGDFTSEIIMANKQKMVALAFKTCQRIENVLNGNEEVISEFETKLKDFKKEAKNISSQCITNTKRQSKQEIESRLSSLKNELFSLIDSNIDKDYKKRKCSWAVSNSIYGISPAVQQIVTSNNENAIERLKSKKKNLKGVSIETPNISMMKSVTLDVSGALECLDVSFEDVLSVAATIAGAAGMGAFGGPVGAGIGALVGVGIAITHKVIGDGGRGKARASISKAMTEVERRIKENFESSLYEVEKNWNESIERINKNIDSEMRKLEQIKSTLNETKSELNNYVKSL